MKSRSFAALLLALAFVPAVRADRAPPPPKEPGQPFVIEAGPKVTDARLIIPKKMLGQVKASLDIESTDQRAILPALHTIVAGGALAVGLAFGGLWLVRRGPTGGRSLALLIGCVAMLAAGGLVWADGVPGPRPPVFSTMRGEKVIIEVTEQGDEVKLIINKDKLAKFVGDK